MPPPVAPRSHCVGRCHLCPRSRDRKTTVFCIECGKFVCGSHKLTVCLTCKMMPDNVDRAFKPCSEPNMNMTQTLLHPLSQIENNVESIKTEDNDSNDNRSQTEESTDQPVLSAEENPVKSLTCQDLHVTIYNTQSKSYSNEENEDEELTNREQTDIPNTLMEDESELTDLKSVVKKLHGIADKLAEGVKGDSFEQFGKYISSLLRGLPSKKVLPLKQKIVADVLNVLLDHERGLSDDCTIVSPSLTKENKNTSKAKLPKSVMTVSQGNSVKHSCNTSHTSKNVIITSDPMQQPQNAQVNSISLSASKRLSQKLNKSAVPSVTVSKPQILNISSVPSPENNNSITSSASMRTRHIVKTNTVAASKSQYLGLETDPLQVVPGNIRAANSFTLATVLPMEVPASPVNTTSFVTSHSGDSIRQDSIQTLTTCTGGRLVADSLPYSVHKKTSGANQRGHSKSSATRGRKRKLSTPADMNNRMPGSAPTKITTETPVMIYDPDIISNSSTMENPAELAFDIKIEECKELSEIKQDINMFETIMCNDIYIKVKEEAPELEAYEDTGSGSKEVQLFICDLCSVQCPSLIQHFTEQHPGCVPTSKIESLQRHTVGENNTTFHS